jgi:hypothetical protein
VTGRRGWRLTTSRAACSYWATSTPRAASRGSNYRYQSIADERVATVGEPIALYQDADPTNDPLLGGGGGSGIHCHDK